MAYKQNAGRGPMPKTGAGIPDVFKSPIPPKESSEKKLVLLKEQSYEQKLKEGLAKIKSKDASIEAKYKKKRQDNVLDSLKTVELKGRKAAAKKYGDKARGKGLPTDASEPTYKTKRYVQDSKERLKSLK